MSDNHPEEQLTQESRGWRQRWSFLIIAVGSAVGLGNLWKMPYEVGENGGGTFLLVYLLCLLFVAFPVMITEIVMGRIGGPSVVNAFKNVALSTHASPMWNVLGWLGMSLGLLIFSFYSVVASWFGFYIMKCLSGDFVDVPAEIAQSAFPAFLDDPTQLFLWHSSFVLLVVMILSHELRGWLESAFRYLALTFVLSLIWLIYEFNQSWNLQASIDYLTTIDIGSINLEMIVDALSQSLFTLSIGVGVLITFGGFMRPQRSIFVVSGMVLVADTAVALAMSIIVFAVVFAFGIDPASGAGLLFKVFPVAFSSMGNSVGIGSVFFLLLLGLGLFSAFTLLYPFVYHLRMRFGFSRVWSARIVGVVAWLVGLVSVFAFNQQQFGFFYFGQEYEFGLFDVFNIVATKMLLPLMALLMLLFAGSAMSRSDARGYLALKNQFLFNFWRFSVRFSAPVVLVMTLLASVLYSLT